MRIALLLPLLLSACAVTTDSPAPSDPSGIMVWDDLFSRNQPQPDERIAYGEGELQFSELWLPVVDGMPATGHPTVFMIHGGCWQTDIAERDIMNWIADDLRGRGIAVWNIEYRGVDREGGGYPGTYEDVLAAADSLIENAQNFNLDTTNTVLIGHSAGGHLALWLGAQQPLTRALVSQHTLNVRTVISQGGLPDLEAGTRREGHPCGTEAPRLMLGDNPQHTSPQRMPASNTREILVNSALDRIAPPEYAEAYRGAQLARDKTEVELVVIPGEGHVELVAPGTASWERQVELIEEALGLRR